MRVSVFLRTIKMRLTAEALLSEETYGQTGCLLPSFSYPCVPQDCCSSSIALPSVFLSMVAVPQQFSSALTAITFPLIRLSIKKWSSFKISSNGTIRKTNVAFKNNGLWYYNKTAPHIRMAKTFAFKTSFFWLRMSKGGDYRRYLKVPWTSLMKEYFWIYLMYLCLWVYATFSRPCHTSLENQWVRSLKSWGQCKE